MDTTLAVWSDLDSFQWQIDDHLLYPLPDIQYPLPAIDDGDDGDVDDSVSYTSYSPSASPSRSSSLAPTYTLPHSTLIAAHLPTQQRLQKPRAKRSLRPPLPVSCPDADADADSDQQPRPKRRKNNPIPLPIPIPNLTKKSRGRKVPRVQLPAPAPAPVPVPEYTYDPRDGTLTLKPRVFFGEGSASSAGSEYGSGPSAQPGVGRMEAGVGKGKGARTYMCEVDGCGKCFIRGEHLKRHVRSIHTHEKPHPCPYEGCDKTFSRRDNLGQHIRVHL